MPLNLHNIEDVRKKLNSCNVHAFADIGSSYKHFISTLKIELFRKIKNIELRFDHPVTVISGSNTVGKTSILMLLACSHEKFMRHDSTSPSIGMREHAWSDILSFTSHENDAADYSYSMSWRVGGKLSNGTGKRSGSTRSWIGLAKKSSDPNRTNAKIRDREVRLIDLERVLPGRSFSNALYRKANVGSAVRLDSEIEQAFQFIFDCDAVEIFEVGSHINKTCFLIKRGNETYSSYNAASGEESVLYLLKDIIQSPKNSLILVDEVEAGFHPSVQRKIADVIKYISWRDKKQFVITTHSPTFVSSFPLESRIFIETSGVEYKVTSKMPSQAIRSKMDSVGHPLVRLYCEDELADFLIRKAVLSTAAGSDLIQITNVIHSGTVDQVKNDYVRHKRNFSQYRNKVGCCAIADGDYAQDPNYSDYQGDLTHFFGFIYPHEAPEKFLVRAYLQANPNQSLQTHLEHSSHHSLFVKMVQLGLAADANDARNECYKVFSVSADFDRHVQDIVSVLSRAAEHYTNFE